MEAVKRGGALLGAWANKAEYCGVNVQLFALPLGGAQDPGTATAMQLYSCDVTNNAVRVPELCCAE